MQLAQDLEWLGCELEHYGREHALAGYPASGPRWDTFLEKQRGVLVTVSKIQRELKNAVRYDPSRMVGVEYPLDQALNSLATLFRALEEIKQCAVFAVQVLPSKVRAFAQMVGEYMNTMQNVQE